MAGLHSVAACQGSQQATQLLRLDPIVLQGCVQPWQQWLGTAVSSQPLLQWQTGPASPAEKLAVHPLLVQAALRNLFAPVMHHSSSTDKSVENVLRSALSCF